MWLGKASFDFELVTKHLSPKDKWYEDSLMAKGLNAHLNAHSAVLAPRQARGAGMAGRCG
jgi:hypothetical protein